MRQAVRHLSVTSRGKGLTEITAAVVSLVADTRITTGLLTLFCRHTSCSLLIQENADPDVRTDLTAFFDELAPEGPGYVHDAEGPDDMPAHIRSALTGVSIAVPIENGTLSLGTWQGIYLFEHRTRPHRRDIVLHLIGE